MVEILRPIFNNHLISVLYLLDFGRVFRISLVEIFVMSMEQKI